GDEEFNYFLSVLFPHNQLEILGYHRVVKDLNGLSLEEFMKRLNEKFIVEGSDSPADPKSKGIIGMYVEGQWYTLQLKKQTAQSTVDRLDVSILQDNILEPILGIVDIRRDERIDF